MATVVRIVIAIVAIFYGQFKTIAAFGSANGFFTFLIYTFIAIFHSAKRRAAIAAYLVTVIAAFAIFQAAVAAFDVTAFGADIILAMLQERTIGVI